MDDRDFIFAVTNSSTFHTVGKLRAHLFFPKSGTALLALPRAPGSVMFPPSQSGARPEFKTDALRPSALPSAAIRPRNEVQQPELTSEQHLNQVYEEWNKKVDVEVETLVDGMVDLVSIATVSKETECFTYRYHTYCIDSCTMAIPWCSPSLFSRCAP